jgi:hypothetical protein
MMTEKTETKVKLSLAALEALREEVGGRYAAAIDDETTTIRTADRLEAMAIRDDETIDAVIRMADEHDMLDYEGVNEVRVLATLYARIEELEKREAELVKQNGKLAAELMTMRDFSFMLCEQLEATAKRLRALLEAKP